LKHEICQARRCVATTAIEPSLLIAVPSGKERWLGLNQNDVLTNAGGDPMEMLRFDFKTTPPE
jgi:hypothetical protein